MGAGSIIERIISLVSLEYADVTYPGYGVFFRQHLTAFGLYLPGEFIVESTPMAKL